MCGIAGIVSLPGGSPVDAKWIKAMTDAMLHRGPDGEGLWLSDDKTVGMGHRRLSIVDLSEFGAQPMIDKKSGIALTYNGEIYNFKDLQTTLKSKGKSFHSQTDTEVLLQQLVQFWTKGLEAIAGDYAFGAWNPSLKSLLLVRDRAGMKPLFYAKTPSKHFVFASELRALLASRLIPFEIDDEALYHYLTYLVSPPGRSLVKGVNKLGIGEAAEINAKTGSIQCWRYWEPLPSQVNSSDDETLFQEFRHLFQKSVRDRLMSDVPVGTLFSGGVDSILNTGVFQLETAPNPVTSFTVGMPGQRTDESAWARQMASQLGTVPYEVMIDTDRIVEDLEQLCWIQDEPVADPVSIPLFYVTKLAREKGTIVLQGGEGADELFCGYTGYIKYLTRKAQFWDRMALIPSPLLKFGASLMSAAQKFHSEAGCYGDILRRAGGGDAFFLSNAVAFYDSEKDSVLSSSYRQRCRGLSSYDVVKPFYTRLEEAVPEASFLQHLTFIELNLRLPELLLMRLDKIAMANSIEVRAPFLDHRLIEFAMSAPQSFKLKDGVAKEPVKRYGSKFVGRDKVYRPKKGFGAPVEAWFQGSLGAEMRILLDQSGMADNYFNKSVLKNRTGRPMSSRQGFQLWIIFNVMKWHEKMSKELSS